MSGLLRYEWIRIRTVRSTWILAVTAIVVPAVLVLLLSWAAGSMDGGSTEGTVAVSGTILLVTAAILCTVGAASFGQEYRHGLIRLTLSQFPRRTPVFLVKAAVVAVVAALVGVAAIAVALVGEALGVSVGGGSFSPSVTDLAVPGLQGITFVVLFVLMAFAITSLTRNQPLGIIVPILMAAVLEPIIVGIASIPAWDWVVWVLPFSATASVGSGSVEAWGHLGVLAAWFLVLAIPAWVLFQRRDA